MKAPAQAAAAFDRSRPPVSGSPRPFRFPPFRRIRLDNGLVVIAARQDRFPLISLELLMPAGGRYDSADLAGLATLHGELLDEGTANRSALEIASHVEALGGSLVSGAGWNSAYAEIGLLSRHLQPGLELLAEVTRTPRFAADELERLRQERQAEILRRRGQPAALANRAFTQAVYGGTVYGQSLIGSEASLERTSRQDVLDFYQRQVGPGGSTLVATGDFDLDDLCAAADRLFGDWPSKPIPQPSEIRPEPLSESQVHIVDRPGSTQTQLQLGHVGLSRSHPDFHTVQFLNAVFGGKFTSRINLNLRERHGYTYGANSFLIRRTGPGPFVIRTAVGTDVAGAAVRELVSELRQIREQPIREDELVETRNYLIGVFPYTVQTVADLTKRLEELVVFDLDDDFYESYPAIFDRFTREQLLAAAREHFHPENLAIVAVGPVAELEPQLADLGPVQVHSPDSL